MSGLSVIGEALQVLQEELPLEELLERLAALIGRGAGFRAVAVNLYRPAWDDLEVVAVHGSDAAREALLGTTSSRESWSELLQPRFLHHGVYLVGEGDVAWEERPEPTFIPPAAAAGPPGAWRPGDALFVPMASLDGELLGVVSADEPLDGARPSEATLELVALLCKQASVAIEHAQSRERRASDRLALERLSRIAPLLGAHVSIEATLFAVCEELRTALGFDRVAIELLDETGTAFVPAATAGWPPADSGLRTSLSRTMFERLVDEVGLTEGCVLATNEQAHAAIGGDYGSSYFSRLNGEGPRAWRYHWLLVPLRLADGSLRGFIWADDPYDRLLPSRARLQSLRLFGDQVMTALTLAEQLQALAEGGARRRALIDSAPVAVIELDRERIVRSWNPAAERIFGWPADRAIGRPNPLVPEDEWEIHVARTEQVLAGGSLDGIRRWLRADGTLVDLRVTSTAIHHGPGEVVGILLLAEDISARVQAEVELRRAEAIHRRVLENAADIIVLIDREGRVVFSTTERVLGYRDATGEPWHVERIHPDDRATAEEAIAAAFAGETPPRSEVRVRHVDGSWRILEGAAVPVRDGEGRPEFVLVSTRDITDRRQLEIHRGQASRLESVGRLTAGIAHDFNNLLTVISGHVELAQAKLDAADSAGVAESLAELQAASDHAARVTHQLLAFSRQQHLQPETIDLNTVVSDIEQMLKPLLGDRVELQVSLAPDLRPCRVDRGQLEQVIVNLAINARDAMPDGGTLRVETANADLDDAWVAAHPGGGPGRSVMLAVADTGHGMDEETVARIFEPFFSTKPPGAGHGLGLASVYGIVKQSGGYLDVESAPGRGTTFRVYVPEHAPAEAPAPPPAPAPAAAPPARDARLTVLLVDDDDAVRAIVARMLESLGHAVISVPTAAAALERIEGGDDGVDVILTDVSMPHMSGTELVERTRRSRPGMRALYISGYASEAVLDGATAATGDVLLAKPFRQDQLAAALARTLR